MNNKPIALITGTSSGLGMYTAIALAQQGYYVLATMRDLNKQAPLKELAEEQQVLPDIKVVQLDVTNTQGMEEAVKQILAPHGRVDVLVNNAGVSLGGFVEEFSMMDWREMMETNLLGTVSLTKAILPYMRQQEAGTIINISSVSGRVGFPSYGAYSASKFAIEGMSESLRLEMLPFGVRVVLIELGAYQTDIWSKNFRGMELRRKENSPYQRLHSAILSYSNSLIQDADHPSHGAEKVVQIIQKKRPKFRYAFGKGARIAIWAKALLPWSWLERMIIRQLRK